MRRQRLQQLLHRLQVARGELVQVVVLLCGTKYRGGTQVAPRLQLMMLTLPRNTMAGGFLIAREQAEPAPRTHPPTHPPVFLPGTTSTLRGDPSARWLPAPPPCTHATHATRVRHRSASGRNLLPTPGANWPPCSEIHSAQQGLQTTRHPSSNNHRQHNATPPSPTQTHLGPLLDVDVLHHLPRQQQCQRQHVRPLGVRPARRAREEDY